MFTIEHINDLHARLGSARGETFLQHLSRHERGETTYLEMCRGLAQSGIEKWTVDTAE